MSKWIAIGLVALVLAAYVVLSIIAGSPKDAIQMVRYALPYMHSGNLHVGDNVPDVTLVSLDGASTFQLREHLQGKPLVLVFGSFT